MSNFSGTISIRFIIGAASTSVSGVIEGTTRYSTSSIVT
jgi:hypothetical protein